MTTQTITVKENMLDVVISDGLHDYETKMPAFFQDSLDLMRAWLDGWITGYAYLANDGEERTSLMHLSLYDIEGNALYIGDFDWTSTML